jgi:DNA polymerase-1
MVQEVAMGLSVDIPPEYRRFDYKLAVTKAEIAAVKQKCEAVSDIGLDTETSGLDIISDFFAGICVCWEPGHAVYMPVAHVAGGNANPDDVKEFLLWLATSGKTLVYHGAAFDIERLRRWWGLPFEYENYHDTMAMCYRLNSVKTTKLKVNTEDYLGFKPLELEDLFGKKKTPKFHQLEVETALWYAAADPDNTLKLHNLLLPRVMQQFKLQYQMDLKLNPIVAKHNCNGILADKRYLDAASEQYAQMSKAMEAEVAEVAGDPKFNVNAVVQVRKLLYDQLKLPVLGHTDKTNQPSTDKKVLAQLRGRHPVIDKIMMSKSFWKFKGYCDAFSAAVRPLDKELYEERGWGRILPNYMHYHVPTNRFACEEPNLQQMPRKREGEGMEAWEDAPPIRAAFKPTPGYFLLESDYSQVEMRVFAGETQAPALMNAFRDRKDVHRAAMAQMRRKPAEEVTAAERQQGKTVNFGLIFGQTPQGLAETLGCGEAEAAELQEEYFRAIPEARTWIEATHQRARQLKGVYTKFGHFRPLPGINSSNLHFRSEAERQAVNTIVQGTAADILRLALIRMEKTVVPKWAEWANQLLTTHDSVLWECREGIDVAAFVADLKEACELKIDTYPELLIDIKTGYDYQNMQEWKGEAGEPQAADVPDSVDTVDEPEVVVAEAPEVRLVIPDGLDQKKAVAFREMLTDVSGGTYRVSVEYAGKIVELPGLYRWSAELGERLDRMGIHEPHAVGSAREPVALDVKFA